mgnify:CR=1 FL=1
MIATPAPIVKDQVLVEFGLIQSASVNSITDFTTSKSNKREVSKAKEMDDFVNTFICHLIFYTVFCISLFFHILIDLGLGSFIKNKFADLTKEGNKTFFGKRPAFV